MEVGPTLIRRDGHIPRRQLAPGAHGHDDFHSRDCWRLLFISQFIGKDAHPKIAVAAGGIAHAIGLCRAVLRFEAKNYAGFQRSPFLVRVAAFEVDPAPIVGAGGFHFHLVMLARIFPQVHGDFARGSTTCGFVEGTRRDFSVLVSPVRRTDR